MGSNDKKSKLSAIFDDLQDTLDSSILNEKPEQKDAVVGVKERAEEDGVQPDRQAKPARPKPAEAVREAADINQDGDFKAIFDDIRKDSETKEFSPIKAEDKPPKAEDKPIKAKPPESSDRQEKAKNIDEELAEALGRDFDVGYKAGGAAKPAGKPALARKFHVLFKASAREFASREQSDGIFKEYGKIYAGELIRLGVCGLIFLILAYMEAAQVFNLALPEVLVFFSSVYILINLQFLLLAAFAARNSLLFGLRSIFRNEINLYAAATVFFAVALAYTLAVYAMRHNAALFNSVAALAMVAASLHNILDIKFEIAGFRAVSSKRPKYGFRLDSAAPPEREVFRDIVPLDTAVGRIGRIAFASNFFSRTGRYKNYGETGIYIYISLAAAIIMSVALAVMSYEMPHILTAAAFLFLGSTPLCAFISSAYPAFRAQKKAQEAGAAFVGANSIEENSEVAILALGDRDIFPPLKMPPVKVYGNNRIEDVLQYLCALFTELDMLPAETFRSSIDWDAEKAAEVNVSVKDIGDTGVRYEADGVMLFAGKAEYIEDIGLRAPTDPEYDEQFLKKLGSIMYLASESEVIAKIYLRYELTANFHDILKNVKRMNSCVCVKTFDPNIDDALLRKLANLKRLPMRVLKLKDAREAYKIEEKAETGVVSGDSLGSMISALLIASKAKRSIKSNALIKNIAFAFNLAALACLVLFVPASAWALLALHGFWAAMIVILSALAP